jgi:hypothetical protein
MPRGGSRTSTFGLRVETHPSSRYQPGRFWLPTSAASSAEYVPGLSCNGRGNDHKNDQADPWRCTRPWRGSDRDQKVAALLWKLAAAVIRMIKIRYLPAENRMTRPARVLAAASVLMRLVGTGCIARHLHPVTSVTDGRSVRRACLGRKKGRPTPGRDPRPGGGPCTPRSS